MAGGRRVLVTGLASFWGGRVAQALEQRSDVEVIVGLDALEPTVELERTEYVRTDESYSILSRIVRATKVDTILHTFLIVDSTQASARTMHEINVIGTMNLFAAAGAPGSTVRDVVVKSSTYVYGTSKDDPNVFSEDTPRSLPPRTPVERSIVEVEGYVTDFALDNPHVNVATLRFPNVLGHDIRTPLSRSLEMPFVPAIFGFDPLLQFVHEDDVVSSVLFAMDRELRGVYNVAGDGLLPWSEIIAIAGRRPYFLPPAGTSLAMAALGRLGVPRLPDELLLLLRYGRGIDNRKLKAEGFDYRYNNAETVDSFIRTRRLQRTVGTPRTYRYERDVEQFFRHSPAIVRD